MRVLAAAVALSFVLSSVGSSSSTGQIPEQLVGEGAGGAFETPKSASETFELGDAELLSSEAENGTEAFSSPEASRDYSDAEGMVPNELPVPAGAPVVQGLDEVRDTELFKPSKDAALGEPTLATPSFEQGNIADVDTDAIACAVIRSCTGNHILDIVGPPTIQKIQIVHVQYIKYRFTLRLEIYVWMIYRYTE